MTKAQGDVSASRGLNDHPGRAEADGLLAEIAEVQAEIADLEVNALAQIRSIQGAYSAHLAPLMERLKAADKALIKLMKRRTTEVFEGEEKIGLPHGFLLHGQEFKVTIPRGALGRIEAHGWTEAVKVAKSVDRGVVEGWPDERLFAIGAERRLVDKFGYETRARRADAIDDAAQRGDIGDA